MSITPLSPDASAKGKIKHGSLLNENLCLSRVNSQWKSTNSGQWERRYAERAASGQSMAEWLAQETRARHIPLGRFGEPHEPATAIAFLASPAASFITGAALEVAGGVSRFA